MAKISLNLPDELDQTIREYAKANDFTLTNALIMLLKKALEAKDLELEEVDSLKEEIKKLETQKKELEEKLEIEKKERLNDYKNLITQNIETNKSLMDLMKADRVLQLEQKKEKPKKPFFQKLKALFSNNTEK